MVLRWLLLTTWLSFASAFATQSRPRTGIHLAAAKRGKAGPKSKKKQFSLESLLTLETDLKSRGYQYLIGCDDTGGAACIAGPVVCASCCVLQPFSTFLPLSTEQPPSAPADVVDVMSKVNDSKMLSRKRRHEIYDTVMSHPDIFAVSVAHCSPEDVDELNLLRATQLAFADSIESLVDKYDLPHDKLYAIVDGKISPKLYASDRIQSNEVEPTDSQQQLEDKIFPVRPKVNADAEVYTCALASIVANVERERIMNELHEQYPEYGFDKNKGSASKDHIEALHRHGALMGVHRYSFKQVKGR